MSPVGGFPTAISNAGPGDLWRPIHAKLLPPETALVLK
jgi:hypothetical protein